MIKWLLKKLVNPETLIKAGVEVGVKKINEKLAAGDKEVIRNICTYGVEVASAARRALAYVQDGTIDETERAEITDLLSPALTNLITEALA